MKINKPSKRQAKIALYIALAIGLIALGVIGTLKVQDSINRIEARGIRKYQAERCERLRDKTGTTWLECKE